MNPIRRARKSAASMAAAMLAAACAPFQRVVNPEYKAADLDGRVLLVAPFDSLLIENMDDYEDDWVEQGRETAPVPRLSLRYAEAVASLVDHATVVADTGGGFSKEDFDSVSLEIPAKDQALRRTFRFPSAAALRKRGKEPDLVLQAFDLRFRRGVGASTGGMHSVPVTVSTPAGAIGSSAMMVGGGTPENLEMSGSYIVWDYRSGAPVTYGLIREISQFSIAMTRDDWDYCFTRAGRSLVWKSPFMGRKYK